jgi:hypothetical protein
MLSSWNYPTDNLKISRDLDEINSQEWALRGFAHSNIEIYRSVDRAESIVV